MKKKIIFIILLLILLIVLLPGIISNIDNSNVEYSNNIMQDISYENELKKHINSNNFTYDVYKKEEIKLNVMSKNNKLTVHTEAEYIGKEPEIKIMEAGKCIKTVSVSNGAGKWEINADDNVNYFVVVQFNKGNGKLKIKMG